MISKANRQALNSSKKWTNGFVFTTMRCAFICFLEDIEDYKKAFRNYLTFKICKLNLLACRTAVSYSLLISCFIPFLLFFFWISNVLKKKPLYCLSKLQTFHFPCLHFSPITSLFYRNMPSLQFLTLCLFPVFSPSFLLVFLRPSAVL